MHSTGTIPCHPATCRASTRNDLASRSEPVCRAHTDHRERRTTLVPWLHSETYTLATRPAPQSYTVPTLKTSGSRDGETNCQTETADVTLKLEQTGSSLACWILAYRSMGSSQTQCLLQSSPNCTGLQQLRREVSQQVFLVLSTGRLREIGAYTLVANPEYILRGLMPP